MFAPRFPRWRARERARAYNHDCDYCFIFFFTVYIHFHSVRSKRPAAVLVVVAPGTQAVYFFRSSFAFFTVFPVLRSRRSETRCRVERFQLRSPSILRARRPVFYTAVDRADTTQTRERHTVTRTTDRPHRRHNGNGISSYWPPVIRSTCRTRVICFR